MIYYQNLNGKALEVGTAAAGAGASIAAASAGLITAGAAAQVIPVVGQILGVLALAGGLLLKQKAKVKNIKNNIAAIEAQNIELRNTSNELDNQIGTVRLQMTSINEQLQRMGLSGFNDLGSLKTFLQKTFTPAKYQSGILKTKEQQNAELTKVVETKISTLESMVKALQDLNTKLTTAKNTVQAKIVESVTQNKGAYIIGGITVLALFGWYVSTQNDKKKLAKSKK